MTSFPLYDIFNREAENIKNPLTNEQLKFIIDTIKTLNQDGVDRLYSIIRYTALLNDDTDVFKAKYGRKGVVFNLEFFPDNVQKMIYVFVLKHINEVQNSEVDIVLT